MIVRQMLCGGGKGGGGAQSSERGGGGWSLPGAQTRQLTMSVATGNHDDVSGCIFLDLPALAYCYEV